LAGAGGKLNRGGVTWFGIGNIALLVKYGRNEGCGATGETLVSTGVDGHPTIATVLLPMRDKTALGHFSP
jgi:hypothetical protein